VDNLPRREHSSGAASAVRGNAALVQHAGLLNLAHMKSRTLLIGACSLAFVSSAHAWFFFMLPTSLFSAKGDTCITSDAKVGDKLTKDGRIYSVKSISGTSSRCTNPATPVLAEVEARTEPVPDNVTQARISIPEGWSPQPITDAMKMNGVVSYYTNRTLDAGLQLATFKRAPGTTTLDLVESKKASQLSHLKEAQQIPTSQMLLAGLPAWRYEVSGRVTSGVDIKYLSTFFEGDSEIVGVIAWTTTPGFDRTRERLDAIVSSVSGISNAAATQVSAMSTTPPVATPAQSAAEPSAARSQTNQDSGSQVGQKLRELNTMLKDGLITQDDYDNKKKELLKSF
jgi:hypothetical protein